MMCEQERRTKAHSETGYSRRLFLGGTLAVAVGGSLLDASASSAGEGPAKVKLWVGAVTADITPDRPVPLTGGKSVRVSRGIQSRCTANVLALESRDGDRVVDQAILVSCDLCVIRPGIQEGFRKHVAARLPGFDITKLFLAATHTHSAPVLLQGRYAEKDYGDAMQPKDYVPWLYQQMAEAVVQAWEGRAVGAVAWGLGHAVVGCNRRAAYADGSAKMYGRTDDPAFRQIEGYEDHAVDILCFYDDRQQLKATAITLACPAQVTEGGNQLSADFWHEVRQRLRARHGQELCVLGFCAPAGDQSPHRLYRKRSEARMDKLRGLTECQELGRRIAQTFGEVVDVIAKDIRSDVPLVHRVRQVDLPARIVTEAEYAEAKKICDGLDAKPVKGPTDVWTRNFYGLVVDRYQAQQQGDRVYPMELHVLRLGDVAIATNPFELYVDYGVQIQARSPAEQTVLIQLAGALDHAYYVPTPRAVQAGGYSAEVTHNLIGPEGAQALVERTLTEINGLWPAVSPRQSRSASR
jgi:hypothetical protein